MDQLDDEGMLPSETLDSFKPYETFVKCLLDGFAVLDIQGKVVKYNKQFTAMTGMKSRQIQKANSLDEIICLGIGDQVMPVQDLLKMTNPTRYDEVSGRCPSKDTVLNLIISFFPLQKNGSTVGAVLIVRDVTAEADLQGKYKEKAVKVEAINRDLEKTIKQRTESIRTILDHVTFGLFICDKHMRVTQGYSQSCLKLLSRETSIEKESLSSLLALDSRRSEHLQSLYDQIFDPDFLLGDLAIAQLPTRFKVGECTLNATGSVVHDSEGKSIGVLFCLVDISNLVQSEEEIERNRCLIKLLSNRDSFRQFLGDTHETLRRLSDEDIPYTQSSMRQELHTIKGNSGVFGLHQIARTIHEIEDKPHLTRLDSALVEEQFRTFLTTHQTLLDLQYGVVKSESYVIPSRLADDVEKKIETTTQLEEVKSNCKEFFERIRRKQARTLIGPIDEAFNQLATRLGKQAALVFKGGETLVPIRLAGVFKNLTHMIRNALDHGIEAPGDRGSKPAIAIVTLDIAEMEQGLSIVVSDDGCGLNLDALYEKAKQRGLPADRMNEQAICNLIFEDGVSTSKEVNDVSGRGVGTSSVKAAVESLGGTITVSSQVGNGTTFRITLPL